MKRFAWVLVFVLAFSFMACITSDNDNGDENTAPVADAGPDQDVIKGTVVTLDASFSSDAEGDSLAYLWSFVSIAGASTPAFSDSTAVDATFMADFAGTYVVSLVVNDGSDDSTADSVTIVAGPASVALFVDDNYVDYVDTTSATTSNDATNVLWHLMDEGLSYTTISGITATDFSTALAGRNSLIIPEQEVGMLYGDLSAAAMSVVRGFVEGGGTIISMMDGKAYALELVNALFGYSMELVWPDEPIAYNAGDGDGTRFEGGPATLDANDQTASIDSTTLPSGSMSMYLDTYGDTVVLVTEEGRGESLILGYDWFDAAPNGNQDGGWVEILNRCLGNY